MQGSVNQVFIIGHVGADPKGISFRDGNMITNFSIATNESWENKSGETQENTQWHNIVVKGRLADIALKYIKKGSHIYIEGSVKTRKYNDINNRTIYIKEIHAHVCQDLNYNK